MDKIVTTDDVWEGIAIIEKYVYTEYAKGSVREDIFKICCGMIEMIKKVLTTMDSVRHIETKLVETENEKRVNQET